MITLEDFKDLSSDKVKEKIKDDFELTEEQAKWLSDATVLVAYMSEGSWGCDSTAWILLKKGKFTVPIAHVTVLRNSGNLS